MICVVSGTELKIYYESSGDDGVFLGKYTKP